MSILIFIAAAKVDHIHTRRIKGSVMTVLGNVVMGNQS